MVMGKALFIAEKAVDIADSHEELGHAASSLAASMEGVKRMLGRVRGGSHSEDVMAVNEVLRAIEIKLGEVSDALGRRWLCFNYGAWLVYGAPLLGVNMGSRKMIKQLEKLGADLEDALRVLELNIAARTAESIHMMSAPYSAIHAAFEGDDARAMWTAAFGDSSTASQESVAEMLFSHIRPGACVDADSFISPCVLLSRYLSARVARAGVVSVKDLSRDIGEREVLSWARESVSGGAATSFLPGHMGPVACLAACGENALVSGGTDCCVKTFSSIGGRTLVLVSVQCEHNARVSCLSACAGGTVASGSADGVVRTWSVHQGKGGAAFPVDGPVVAICCIGDAVAHASAGSQCITVSDVATGAVRTRVYGHPGGVTCLASSGATLLSAGADRAVRIWEIEGRAYRMTGEIVQAHARPARHIVVAASFFASVSDFEARVFGSRGETEPVIASRAFPIPAEYRVAAACAHRDSVLVAVSSRKHSGGGAVGQAGRKSGFRWSPLLDKPSSIVSMRNGIYVGFESGRVSWFEYEEGFLSRRGDVAPVSGAVSPPLLSTPAPAALPVAKLPDGNSALVCMPDGSVSVLDFGTTSVAPVLPASRCAIAAIDSSPFGTVVCRGSTVVVYDSLYRETARRLVDGAAFVAQSSSDRVFVAVSHSDDSVSILAAGADLAFELVSMSEKTCPQWPMRVVLGRSYLVWPGATESSLAVLPLSSCDGAPPRGPADVPFATFDGDPVTAIASTGVVLVTLHGSLDVMLWGDPTVGPYVKVGSIPSPAVTIDIEDAGHGRPAIVAGGTDGAAYRLQFDDVPPDEAIVRTHPFVAHPVGCVSVAVQRGARRFASVGNDGSVFVHDILSRFQSDHARPAGIDAKGK